jgi:SPP1 family phage portal protein
VLRGYEGESLAEFMLNLQKFKAIKLSGDENASAEPMTVEIPEKARISLMEWLEKKIYEVGQGVNETILTGGSITNVAIKALYAGLKSKSDTLITKMRFALEHFMFFVVEYINNRDSKTYDYKDINFIFNTSMIFNENEILQTLKDMGVKVSQKTLLANVPFIDDVDAEIELVKIEDEENLKKFGTLGFDE